MRETVEAAKAEFLRAKGRVTSALASTPDDKINWSPSSTARTPIEEVVHSALSIKGMQGWLDGNPFPFESMKALDDYSRSREAEFKTRESALELLETHSNEFISWLDGLSDEKVASTFSTPMGDFPMASAITFPADHLRAHASQMDYIQTIYGDREWHMG